MTGGIVPGRGDPVGDLTHAGVLTHAGDLILTDVLDLDQPLVIQDTGRDQGIISDIGGLDLVGIRPGGPDPEIIGADRGLKTVTDIEQRSISIGGETDLGVGVLRIPEVLRT